MYKKQGRYVAEWINNLMPSKVLVENISKLGFGNG